MVLIHRPLKKGQGTSVRFRPRPQGRGQGTAELIEMVQYSEREGRSYLVMDKFGSVRFSELFFWTQNRTVSSVLPIVLNFELNHWFWFSRVRFWFSHLENHEPNFFYQKNDKELIKSTYFLCQMKTKHHLLQTLVLNSQDSWSMHLYAAAWLTAATCLFQYALLRICRASKISAERQLWHAVPVIPPLLKALLEGVNDPWMARYKHSWGHTFSIKGKL